MNRFERMFACLFLLAPAVLLLNLSATAQTPIYKPGQTIRISVTFEGLDAGKVTGAGMNLTLPDQVPRFAQPGFSSSECCGDSKPTGRPNTFEVSWKIPDNQASGDYQLTQLRAIFNDPGVTLSYVPPVDFPARTFRIDNPRTLVKPSVKDVKELP